MPNRNASRSTFSVGAAKISITPPENLFPLTTFEGVQFRRVHAPIYVRAIVIANEEKTIAVLTFELLHAPRRHSLRRRISQALRIPPENVFLAATHNHSFLPLSDEDGLIKSDNPNGRHL